MAKMSDMDRFMRHVQKTDYCWLWTASRNDQGYGYFHLGTEGLAHRASWMLFHGPIPDGMDILHTCDNPPCVNPDHHYLGTDTENVKDRQDRNRTPKGIDHAEAIYTEEQVREIRRIYHPYRFPYSYLAKKYGGTSVTIRNVVKKKSYKDVK